MSDFDSPWKEALDRFLPAFLAFFFPEVFAAIDWSKGYESLDTELQQIVHEAELGRRLADKLFKVWRKDGAEAWLLIHVEVQNQPDVEDIRQLFRLIDWLMTLPKELEDRFTEEIHRFEEEKKMPYITSVERVIVEKAQKKSREEGHEEGLKEGLEKGLRQGIEVALGLKFGSEGEAFVATVNELHDLETLSAIQKALRTATSIDDIRKLIKT